MAAVFSAGIAAILHGIVAAWAHLASLPWDDSRPRETGVAALPRAG